jgi:hypothetical protein
VTQTTATITGTVDTKGLQTSYGFEVGTDTNYGTTIYGGEAGRERGSAQVTQAVGDLQPGTTYHYRLCATNEDGTSCGAEGTFTTLSFASPIVQPPTLALLSIPAIAFPAEAQRTAQPKPPTHAQKLAKALKGCRKDRKSKRAGCERQARKKYGPVKKKRK